MAPAYVNGSLSDTLDGVSALNEAWYMIRVPSDGVQTITASYASQAEGIKSCKDKWWAQILRLKLQMQLGKMELEGRNIDRSKMQYICFSR